MKLGTRMKLNVIITKIHTAALKEIPDDTTDEEMMYIMAKLTNLFLSEIVTYAQEDIEKSEAENYAKD